MSGWKMAGKDIALTDTTDRYGQSLVIGDRVLIATLAHKRAHLREGEVRRISLVSGAPLAGIRTEAGGYTTASSMNMVRAPQAADQDDRGT